MMTVHISPSLMAYNGDFETRLLNLYRRELEIVNSKSMPEHWKQTSAFVCADIIEWLGYTPDMATDSAPPSHKGGVRSGNGN